MVRRVPECGGQGRLNPKGCLFGAPKLVAEVSASTVSLDVRDKLTAYRRAGVREDLVWRTEDGAVDWWLLEEDEYRPSNRAPTVSCATACYPASGST